jgi:hypothetical protein
MHTFTVEIAIRERDDPTSFRFTVGDGADESITRHYRRLFAKRILRRLIDAFGTDKGAAFYQEETQAFLEIAEPVFARLEYYIS